jgi:hypothetical protein
MSYDNWPVIHVFPNGTPSDAELEAQRDEAHAKAVQDWNAKAECACGAECYGYCTWPIAEVVG